MMEHERHVSNISYIFWTNKKANQTITPTLVHFIQREGKAMCASGNEE
jgi:hypothetical protein